MIQMRDGHWYDKNKLEDKEIIDLPEGSLILFNKTDRLPELEDGYVWFKAHICNTGLPELERPLIFFKKYIGR